jgi:hypothetical protein
VLGEHHRFNLVHEACGAAAARPGLCLEGGIGNDANTGNPRSRTRFRVTTYRYRVPIPVKRKANQTKPNQTGTRYPVLLRAIRVA